MNWFILTHNEVSKEETQITTFLEKHNTPYHRYENKKKSDELTKCEFDSKVVLELKRILPNITHCIIFDAFFYEGSPLFLHILGYFEGKQIPLFVTNLSEKQKKSGLFNFARAFETTSQMLENMKENYGQFIEEEEKQLAHKKLFDKGIPFNPDSFSFYIAKNDNEISQLFYQAGMDVNSRDSAGTPMLCIAARNARKEMIEWLLSLGADIDAVSKDRGYSPVMDAVWKSNLEITKLLIDKGANLNFISRDGQPLLVLATGTGNEKICTLLARNGADATIKDHMGMSALDYAKLFKKENLISLYQE